MKMNSSGSFQPNTTWRLAKANKSIRIAQRREARLFLSGASILCASVFLLNPFDYEIETRFLALLAFVIGVMPMARWLFLRDRAGMPIFEIYMLFYAICFGFAGFMDQKSTLTARSMVTMGEWQDGLLAVIVSLVCTAAGFYLFLHLKRKTYTPALWPFILNPTNSSRIVHFVLPVLLTVFLLGNWIPTELIQIVQLWSLFWFFVLVVASIKKVLTRTQRLIVFLLIPANALVFSGFSNAVLYGLFQVLVLVALAFFSLRRRIPYVIISVVVITFILLQPVKGEYRSMKWAGSEISNKVNVVDFFELAIDRLSEHYKSGGTTWEWFNLAFMRINHLHVAAAVIADTPSVVPYQYGKTYSSLFTKLIPRILWQDKPEERTGNQWAHMYGYLYRDDTVTSFNLPWLPEMYMNFGMAGVIILSLIVGILLGFLTSRFWMHQGDSTFTAFSLVLALPFLTPESNFSLLFGRAIIGAIVAYFSMWSTAVLFSRFRSRMHVINRHSVGAMATEVVGGTEVTPGDGYKRS